MEKKGQLVTSIVVKIILILIVIFVLLVFVWQIYITSSTAIGEDAVCKESVKQYALRKFQNIEFADAEINCPVKNLTLSGDKESLKKQIADELYRCWDNYGRGELELFYNKGTKRYCSICSHIVFENEELYLENFTTYLVETKTPKGDMYYYDFLTGVRTTPDIIDDTKKEKNAYDNILTERDYYILYSHYNEGEWSKEKEVAIGIMAGIAVATLVTGGAMIGVATLIASATFVGSTAAGLGVASTGVTAAGTGVGFSVTSIAFGVSIIGDEEAWDAAVQLVDTENFTQLHCQELPTRFGGIK